MSLRRSPNQNEKETRGYGRISSCVGAGERDQSGALSCVVVLTTIHLRFLLLTSVFLFSRLVGAERRRAHVGCQGREGLLPSTLSLFWYWFTPSLCPLTSTNSGLEQTRLIRKELEVIGGALPFAGLLRSRPHLPLQ